MGDNVSPAGELEKMKLNSNSQEDDDIVDPWNVASKSNAGVDYDKLISKYTIFINFCFCGS